MFDASGCYIYNKDEELIATAEMHNNIYRLRIQQFDFCLQTSTNSANVWHRRLGHLSDAVLGKMIKRPVTGLKINSKINNKFNCEPCCEGKQTRNSFGNTGSRAKSLLEIIHTDLCGRFEIKSIDGAQYCLLFVDDYSRMVFVYFLKQKSVAFNCRETNQNRMFGIRPNHSTLYMYSNSTV